MNDNDIPLPNTHPSEQFVLISPMRNEGPYILEWLAWHRALGFTDILIATNDCTDGSDALLKHLAQRGLVTHVEHNPKAGKFALSSAFTTLHKHPLVRHADWVMILDADEYLVVHIGDNTVQALIQENGQDWLGMAIHWKCFGDGDQAHWRDSMVRETFTSCGESAGEENMRFKSIFREPAMFGGFMSHAPHSFHGIWGGDNRWADSSGQKLNKLKLVGEHRQRATKRGRIIHEAAQVNHYVLKFQECLLERREKWKTSGRDARYDEEFRSRYNKNFMKDLSATQNTERFDKEYNDLIGDPETVRLHHVCCAKYVEILCENADTDPINDERYKMHKKLVVSLTS